MNLIAAKFLLYAIALCYVAISLSGCSYLAAGAAGAVVGHEIADDDEDED